MVRLQRKDNGKIIELSKKVTPKKAAPKKASPKKAVPKKVTPKKAVPKKAAPKPLKLKNKMEIIIDRKTKNPLRKRKKRLT